MKKSLNLRINTGNCRWKIDLQFMTVICVIYNLSRWYFSFRNGQKIDKLLHCHFPDFESAKIKPFSA